MADDGTLVVEPRQVTGKKVRRLRRDGIVPGNLYGRGLPSVAVQAPLNEFRRVFRARGRNAVISLQVAGEDKARPVILRSVQRHPVTDEVQHIDLYQVDLSRPVHAAVSVLLTGESEAVHNGGVLVHTLAAIEVEALPNEIPESFVVGLSGLLEFGDSVHVRDLPVPPGVRILTDGVAVVVAVQAPRVLEEPVTEEEPVEGEELAEGEEPSAEGEEASAAGEPSASE